MNVVNCFECGKKILTNIKEAIRCNSCKDEFYPPKYCENCNLVIPMSEYKGSCKNCKAIDLPSTYRCFRCKEVMFWDNKFRLIYGTEFCKEHDDESYYHLT